MQALVKVVMNDSAVADDLDRARRELNFLGAEQPDVVVVLVGAHYVPHLLSCSGFCSGSQVYSLFDIVLDEFLLRRRSKTMTVWQDLAQPRCAGTKSHHGDLPYPSPYYQTEEFRWNTFHALTMVGRRAFRRHKQPILRTYVLTASSDSFSRRACFANMRVCDCLHFAINRRDSPVRVWNSLVTVLLEQKLSSNACDGH